MTAKNAMLDLLSENLWKRGVAGFCPTTLSVAPEPLEAAVSRWGHWIRGRSFIRDFQGALPLGIHLEGPFIHPQARGAHPAGQVRPLDRKELESLWEASQGTLKILTVAPEMMKSSEMRRLVRWCEPRRILLSLGHSRASQEQARQAFEAGFHGVTHAWNALSFHHRSPGALGAAIGFPGLYLELIVDGVHVSPTVIQWTRQLHAPQPICFVSDCVTAAGTCPAESREPGPWQEFGPLRIQYRDGACRLESGELAGGGRVLSEAFCRWVNDRFMDPLQRTLDLGKAGLNHLNRDPLRALGIPARALKGRQVRWCIEKGLLTCHPLS